MSNTLRKLHRGIARKATQQLYVQQFISRRLWTDFEAELSRETDPPDPNEALHSLLASWVQGRRDSRVDKSGLIQVVPGTLLSRLEAKEKHGSQDQS